MGPTESRHNILEAAMEEHWKEYLKEEPSSGGRAVELVSIWASLLLWLPQLISQHHHQVCHFPIIPQKQKVFLQASLVITGKLWNNNRPLEGMKPHLSQSD